MSQLQTLFQRFRKDRKLGIAEDNGRYDLPLNQSVGTGFLILLVGLMTFLAMMAISANYGLGGLTARWTSGLENVMTIEIPAARKDKKVRSQDEIAALENSIEASLKDNPDIKSLKIMSKEDITALVSPWLGDDIVLDDIPLPGMISVEMSVKDEVALKKIDLALDAISPDIRIETHQDWLDDIVRLASSLKFSALLITMVIGVTTVVAIAGGIRSRMAEHQADITLLHLIGANDYYITRQFQRHALIMGLKGSVAGVFCGFIALGIMTLISRGSASAVLPDFSFSLAQILGLLSLPLLICLIAAITARVTVLRSLARMP
jgi:cell division transport system permease protein